MHESPYQVNQVKEFVVLKRIFNKNVQIFRNTNVLLRGVARTQGRRVSRSARLERAAARIAPRRYSSSRHYSSYRDRDKYQ